MSPNTAASSTTARLRELPTLAQLPARVSLWDASVSRDRVSESSALTAAIPGSLGWTQTTDGHIASVLVRRPSSNSDRWTVSIADLTLPRVRDSVLDLAIGSRGEDHDDLGEPIAAPGLRGHRLVRDPAGVRGTPLRGLMLRVAHAWAMRDPSLLDADTISGPAPRLVAYRDVRERVARLAPVFVIGDDVQPILADDQIIWAVNLYSASNKYPLSQHWTLAGAERSYFRFAATALVDANTGRVRFVASDRPDAIARSWFALAPSLVIAVRDLPPSIADLLPAATDGSIAQLRTFARYGSRLDGTVVRHLPDSAPMGSGLPPHLVGNSTHGTTAWSVALLDGGDTLDGVITSVGGRQRATYWDSISGPRLRWTGLTERLRASLDSLRANAAENGRRDPRMRLGRINVVPTDHGPVLVQSLILNRADGAPFVSQVAVLDGARVAIGGTVGDAVAALRGVAASPKRATDWLSTGGAARDQHVARLYDVMRDAMRRGDWLRFGAAFDSLGLVLGKASR